MWGLWFGVRDLGFRVQGAGFRVQGAGFRVQGSGFRVLGSGGRRGYLPRGGERAPRRERAGEHVRPLLRSGGKSDHARAIV